MEVLASRFLSWYFSGPDDAINLGQDIMGQLLKFGKAEITVQELYDSCGYIPGFLVEGCEDLDKDFNPEDLKLINDFKVS